MIDYPFRSIRLRLACGVVALFAAGCAARPATNVVAVKEQAGPRAPGESLEAFMGKVRQLSAEARAARTPLTTIEASDPSLAGAIAGAAAQPSPATYRAAAAEYGRLGIGDRAHEYLMKALRLDAADWRTHDALARLWRDQGFPHLGLGDAYRAVHYGPREAAVRNTLGTIFQALGRRVDAARQYERTLALDPDAAYALNNLCYTRFLMGEPSKAIEACERALAIEPGLVPAHNNLALAHASRGDLAKAESILRAAGSSAAGNYNVGMVNLAGGRYRNAVEAFAAAQTARPASKLTAARLRQAEQLLERITE